MAYGFLAWANEWPQPEAVDATIKMYLKEMQRTPQALHGNVANINLPLSDETTTAKPQRGKRHDPV